MSLFKKAEKSQTKLRMAITGPAGSGKTLGALKIARGLAGPNGKIALIDTENASAAYYADSYPFDTAQMTPPYLVAKYTSAISEAEAAGYDVIIVDSLSHAWAGEGGILQRKEQLDSRGGNSFTNWGKMTPEQNALINAVLHSKANIICTMRSKMEYTLQENAKNKLEPKKIGLAPVQRDGFEYEFDIVLDIDLDTHTAKASKDRTGVFVEKIFQITEHSGAAIKDWQKSGPVLKTVPAVTEHPPQITRTVENVFKPGRGADYMINIGKKHFGKLVREVRREELISYMDWLETESQKKNRPLTNNEMDFLENVQEFLLQDDPLGRIPL